MIATATNTDILNQLKILSPVNKGAKPRRGMRYPQQFKDLVLKAVDRKIPIEEILLATGLNRASIYQWRKRRKDKPENPQVRRLHVVEEAPPSPVGTGKANVRLGSAVIEIAVGDLTHSFLKTIAGV